MKLDEANKRWVNFAPLQHHFASQNGKQIKDVFFAPEDEFIASEVYRYWQSQLGFPLNETEKKNPYVWIAFTDKTFAMLSSVLDEKLEAVLDYGGIPPVDLTVEDNWSEYVKWHKGFGIALSYTSQPFFYEINDEGTDHTVAVTIPVEWRSDIYLNYWDINHIISGMTNPRIRFKAEDFKTAEVSLVFDVRP